jgi:methylthioribose-1-phosphate isomerase
MQHHIIFNEADGALELLDQRYLPMREETFVCRTTADVIEALQVMVVRGAPAIGVTAAYGCWIALQEVLRETGPEGWADMLRAKLLDLENARPTAVNLRWAVEKMRELWDKHPDADADRLGTLWLATAKGLHAEDIEINRKMGLFGAELMPEHARIMTHCNAGALATAGYGTALGVVRAAVETGKAVEVIANETRPFLQGARLTAYELAREEIPVRVACDNACGLLMRKGLVDVVVVGADRIAANGDIANKIGTYSVAVLAKEHGVPFYVAAPSSTFDMRAASGEEIPIEERTPREVTHPTNESQITPAGVEVYNFAFDITPSEYVAAIITEKGVIRPPYVKNIKQMIGEG